jgi:UDP-N-acetylmuramate dehydrogenase
MALCLLIGGAIRGEVLANEPLSRHTSLKVGGTADCLVTPADQADLQQLLALLQRQQISYLVMGGGYNLLVRDGGFRGAVISLARLDRCQLLENGRLKVEAGVKNRELVRVATKATLSGVEFLCGIPGSVGGALAMNAGAHGQAILDRVERLVTLRDGELAECLRSDLDYGYRFLTLAPGEVIVSAVLQLEKQTEEEIEARIAGYLKHRSASQQVGYPNAGSFFKNPPAGAAWKLIDDAGLRGHRIGGAQVSELHSNFLVNRGDASAADFLALAALIKERVRTISGIELQEEVRIVGEE